MASYTPYNLEYVHLPPLPLHPHSIPELHILGDESLPIAEEAYSEPSHPEHAVSVIHDQATNLLARNIFNGYVLELRPFSPVISRTRKSNGTGSEIIRVFFPEPLRPLSSRMVCVSSRDKQLYALVVSQTNLVYRLRFPLGAFISESNDRFVFNTDEEDYWEQWPVPDDVIVACGGVGATTVLDENTIVLGAGDGGIVILTRSEHSNLVDGIWEATHHRGSSKFRLPSLFSRSANSHEQIISFAEFNKENHIRVLYTLSRDQKLRAWNAQTGSCLKTLELRSTSQALISRDSDIRSSKSLVDGPVNMICIIHHPNPTSRYSHLVIAFVPSSHDPGSPGYFSIYRITTSGTAINEITFAGEKFCSKRSVSSEIRGFEITSPAKLHGVDNGWRLWVTWDKEGLMTCESIPMDDIFQFTTYVEANDPPLLSGWQPVTSLNDTASYDATYFDKLLSSSSLSHEEPTDNRDIAAVFLDHLFHPGRFSTLTLRTALDEYIYKNSRNDDRDWTHLSSPSSTLYKRYSDIIGHYTQIQYDTETGAPLIDAFRKEQKLEWLGVWSTVRDLDRQSRWPATTCKIKQTFYILSREGFAVPVLLDQASVVYRIGKSEINIDEFVALQEHSLRGLYPELGEPAARVNTAAIAISGNYLVNLLKMQDISETQDESEPLQGTLLDAFVKHVDDSLSDGLQMPPEIFAGVIREDFLEANLTQDDKVYVSDLLSRTSSIIGALEQCISILENTLTSTISPVFEELSFSGLGNALISSVVVQIVEARHVLAQNILLTVMFYLSECGISDEDDKSEVFISVIARALVGYHRYRVLRWLVSQSGYEAVGKSQVAKEDKASRIKRKYGEENMTSLPFRRDEEIGVDSDEYLTDYSLLHSLLAKQIPQCVPEEESVSLPSLVALKILNQINILTHGQVDLAARAPDVILGQHILNDGHPYLAGVYSCLYPLSPGMAYLRGRACLENDDIDDAVTYLQKAASGVKDGSLASILPSTTGPNGLCMYYTKISDAFKTKEIHEAVAQFGSMAIEAAKQDGPNMRDLWTRVFMANLDMGFFEEAYSTFTNMPFLDMKRDYLGQLISEMCEHDEIGRFNSLGFVNYQKNVEDVLRFKARHSDPLRTPNYYKVLYSWQITRGNYRSAGEIMYLQGRRYAENTDKSLGCETSVLRARSYLAAINALSLLEKKDAWISVTITNRPVKPVPVAKRRKTSYIPEEEFTEGKKNVDIVTLEDIKMEYTLVLSQLKLSKDGLDITAV
ncbi:uncharacterized protein L203_103979 [Cryptococcus depauperatus CBS 7841]|uniref:Nuclear pore complex protein Nup160 n=1 Tax=Cryptococcus depauperatus CBS 7841 TaxID=1295531 RepID=A0AAJ8JUS5_9TREE